MLFSIDFSVVFRCGLRLCKGIFFVEFSKEDLDIFLFKFRLILSSLSLSICTKIQSSFSTFYYRFNLKVVLA